MPPSLTDRTACPGLELLSCELLANPAALHDVQVLNTHKTPSSALSRMGQNSRFLPSLWFTLCRQSPIGHVSEELYNVYMYEVYPKSKR